MADYKIAVLASGGGTNLQALIDKVHNQGIADIVMVASDNAQAFALERAAAAGIPAHALPPRIGEGSKAYHRRLADIFKSYSPALLVLAGYMRLLPEEFVAASVPIINVHPSLLPAFPGLDAPVQALAYGAKISGCTVHLVDEGMDTGPVIIQEAIPILVNDTPESLHTRIKVLEHLLLVKTVKAFAQDRVTIEGSKLWLEEDINED